MLFLSYYFQSGPYLDLQSFINSPAIFNTLNNRIIKLNIAH